MPSQHDRSPAWIGPEISAVQIAAVFAVGLPAAFISATQPLLAAALARQNLLSAAQLGQAATLEFAGIALVTLVTLARLKPTRIRPVTGLAALGFAAANWATPYCNPGGILAARTVSGAFTGIFMWQLLGMYARSTLPARLNGQFLAIQGILGLALTAAYANLLLPRFGAQGGYAGLAVIGLLAAVASRWVPPEYVALKQDDDTAMRPNLPGLVALSVMVSSIAALVAAWTYLPALAGQRGFPSWVIGVGVPLAIGAQVLGGMAAVACASRLLYRVPLVAGTVLFMADVFSFAHYSSAAMFLAGLGAFGFLWMGMGPFFYSYALAADRSRWAVLFVGPAQLLGCGIGPILASIGIADGHVGDAMNVAVALFALSLGLFAFGQFLARPAAR